MKDIKIIDVQYTIGQKSETLEQVAEKLDFNEKQMDTHKRVGIQKLFKFNESQKNENGIIHTITNLVEKTLDDNGISLNEINGICGSGNVTGKYLMPTLTTTVAG